MKTISKPVTTVAVVEKKAGPVINSSEKLAIKSQADYDAAASVLSQIKAQQKTVKIESDKELVPLKQGIDAVKERWAGITKRLLAAESDLKNRMLVWANKQEEKRKAIEAKFEEGKIKTTATLEKQLATVTPISATAQVRKKKIYIITDESAIPRVFMVPDMGKIKESFENGLPVPGVKIDYENIIASR